MTVTIKKIAKLAKVSIGTVDRVLHNRGEVSKQTADNIHKILTELNYRPNVIASSLSSTKTIIFGVLMPNPKQDDRYWELPKKGIRKAEEEYREFKIKIEYYFFDKYSDVSFQATCNQVKRDMAKLNGLLIAPVLSKSAEKFIKEIPAELPYVFFDSNIPDTKCVSFIGQKSFQSGIVAAKLMSISIKKPGTIAVLRVLPEDYHIDDRVAGFRSYFRNDNKIEIKLAECDRLKSDRIFQNVTEQIVSESHDLQGIFVPNACTNKVAKSIIARDLSRKIYIIGYDLIDQNKYYLKNGMIDFLLSQRPEVQGYQGIVTLFRYVRLKKHVEANIFIPIDILTKENIDSYRDQI